MAEKLKPCPFCGGNGLIYQEKHGVLWNRAYTWTATCADCMAEIKFFPTREMARAKWNRRIDNAK